MTKSTTFQQGQTSSIGNYTGYAWSDANNWTNGIPVDGDNVVFDQGTTSNPDGYVDIDNLYLDELTLTQGFIAVTDTLGIGEIAFSADFGEIGATTYPGNSTALLTIDGFANANRGYIEADGAGAVVNVLAITDPGEVYLADGGGEVEITATPNVNSTLQFSSSYTPATFALFNPGSIVSAGLYDADVGKSVALPGSSVSAVTFGAHSIAITTNLGTTTFSNVFYGGAEPTGYTASADPSGLERITFEGIACFAAGTRILCIDGDRPVEDIAVGDRLVTIREGGPVSRRVVWIGRRAIDIARHPRPETVRPVRPVRIIAGAFGQNVPERDLRLSPLHAVYIDGGLFEAISLVNGKTIYQEHATRHVTYHHIELDAHDVVLAEGLPAESFLDTGDRTMFEAASGVVVLHPDFATPDGTASCAPMIRDGEQLHQVRAELDARIRQRA